VPKKANEPEVKEEKAEQANPFANFPQTHGAESEITRRIQAEQAQERKEKGEE
jgi:hypothetical protein